MYFEQYVWMEEDNKPFVSVEYLETKDVFIKTKFLLKSNEEEEETEGEEQGGKTPKTDEELFKKFYIWLRNIYLLSPPFSSSSPFSPSTSSSTPSSSSSTPSSSPSSSSPTSSPSSYPYLKIKTSSKKRKKKEEDEKEKMNILWNQYVEKEFMDLKRPDFTFSPTFKQEWIKN